MICQTCSKKCTAQYWNKNSKKWECEKCHPYCKSEKVWKKYLDKNPEITQYNLYDISPKYEKK